MKKYILTIAMILIANVMYAQHEAIEVVPGSDGELPVTNISKTPDGYTQDQATEIALSAEQPKFTGVDYKLEGNNIIALGYTGIVSILCQDSDSSIFSIDGRKGQSKGVNIIRLSNGKTMKVVK